MRVGVSPAAPAMTAPGRLSAHRSRYAPPSTSSRREGKSVKSLGGQANSGHRSGLPRSVPADGAGVRHRRRRSATRWYRWRKPGSFRWSETDSCLCRSGHRSQCVQPRGAVRRGSCPGRHPPSSPRRTYPRYEYQVAPCPGPDEECAEYTASDTVRPDWHERWSAPARRLGDEQVKRTVVEQTLARHDGRSKLLSCSTRSKSCWRTRRIPPPSWTRCHSPARHPHRPHRLGGLGPRPETRRPPAAPTSRCGCGTPTFSTICAPRSPASAPSRVGP